MFGSSFERFHAFEVLLEQGRAVGVRCSKGELRAEAVVCNAPIWDAAKLLPKAFDGMKQDWQDTPMTRSYLHLHVGLDAQGVDSICLISMKDMSGLDPSKLEPHYTSMSSWQDVTAEQNMVPAPPP